MKKILTFAAIVATTLTSYSQSLGYNDLGILFGQDNNYGTSRFNAMSGAFGALGGDVSSIAINPSGGAVANNSLFSATIGSENSDVSASYYGNSSNFKDDFFNIFQAGAIFVFDTAYSSDWNKFALSFNYRLKNNFKGEFSTTGNSEQALFNEHPGGDTSTPTINQYNNGQEQRFTNVTDGKSSVFSLGFSAAHQNKLYVGGSINIHDVKFQQRTQLRETNEDENGNILNAFNEQISAFEGNGFSLGLGFIYKLHQNFRVGLAYESPTWYAEIIEESNIAVFDPKNNRYDDWLGYTEISATNVTDDIDSGEEFNQSVFELRTPSKITASGAIIFNKQGLLSIDYIYKNYTNTKLSNGDFTDVNRNFSTDFRATHAVNIGTEWRFDKMSLRAGYHYEQSPLKNALDGDNLKGYSAGFGYNFGNIKFDLAYRQSKANSSYRIYNNVNVDPIELSKETSRITGTLTFNL